MGLVPGRSFLPILNPYGISFEARYVCLEEQLYEKQTLDFCRSNTNVMKFLPDWDQVTLKHIELVGSKKEPQLTTQHAIL